MQSLYDGVRDCNVAISSVGRVGAYNIIKKGNEAPGFGAQELRRMNKLILILGLLLTLIVSGCGAVGDPILDDLYTRNVYPGAAGTYSIGSEGLPYLRGWFNDGIFDDLAVENELTVNELTAGDGLEIRTDGTIKLVEMSNASALPGSLYFSTDNNTLVYKDSSGVLHGAW